MVPPASQQVLRLPGAVALAMRPLPLAPLEMALARFLSGLLARHPGLVGRLAADPPRRIAVAPSDLPFVFLLEAGSESIALKVVRTRVDAPADACISGPLLALLGLVDGTYDGDALFFSRDLSIEGDIEAVLALRNAIDDADIDLLDEAAASLGAPAVPIARAARSLAAGLVRTFSRVGGAYRGTAP